METLHKEFSIEDGFLNYSSVPTERRVNDSQDFRLRPISFIGAQELLNE